MVETGRGGEMIAIQHAMKDRLWTAVYAALAAFAVSAIFGRLPGVFYAYLLFDLGFSMLFIPSLIIGRQVEQVAFFALTAVWLGMGWLLACPLTRLLFT
tara:strand:+ start:420 stop:716 length:297 start_codon:yes stop_codon:yes gene_type:complete